MCIAHQAQGIAEQSTDAFAEKLLTTLNNGALCLMISIGHRSGLLDAMDGLQPSPPLEIAKAANKLNPSLGDTAFLYESIATGIMRSLNDFVADEMSEQAMALINRDESRHIAVEASGDLLVTDVSLAAVVRVDPVTGLYHLPPSHAAVLTRKNPADNMAVFAQYIPGLANVEDDILECFKNGGGVGYEKFPRFHAVMEEDSGQSVVSSLESHILPLVPGIVEQLKSGIRVLDLGCGRGRALTMLAARFPKSEFLGYDLSEDAIGYAQHNAASAGLTNVKFEARDLSDFDNTAIPEHFDLATTFDAVHDQAFPLRLVKGIRRTLKPDGVYLMQDIHGSSDVRNNLSHPLGTLLYTVSCLHCMTVSLAQGGEGLGAMWGREQAEALLAQAGFQNVKVHRLDHDVQNDYYVARVA